MILSKVGGGKEIGGGGSGGGGGKEIGSSFVSRTISAATTFFDDRSGELAS